MNAAEIYSAMTTANEHFRAGRLAESEGLCRQILQDHPNQAEALSLLSIAARQANRFDEAIDLASRAVMASPRVAMYHANLAEFSRAAGNLDQALASFRRAIELSPGEATFHNSLGTVLGAQRNYELALRSHEQAFAIRPDYADAHTNSGAMLRQLDRLDDAIAAIHTAIRCDPANLAAHHNLGLVLTDQEKLTEAVAAYSRAIEINPGYVEAHTHLGMLHLLLGDFDRGWREHEWRSEISRRNDPRRWRGEPLDGKTILLVAEQGFGDAIQFVRYVPMVASRGGQVILSCRPELVRLFADVQGVTQIVPVGQPLPRCDVFCPLLSLPLAFGTTLETIPAKVPYLRANKSRLPDQHARPRIGIAWSGNPQHREDRRRSIPPGSLAALFSVKEVDFFSLQKGADLPKGIQTIDLTPELSDFAETAALIQSLDLLITVDTSVAHLAGAMGKPVWVFLAANPDWRWMLARADSPWYPTMRLFRQKRRGDWTQPIEDAAHELAAFAASGRFL